MLTTRSRNNKIESKKLALASAKSIVKEISKKIGLTERDKSEAVNILAILLDSGIGIEEKMRRIGRAPAGSAFVKELKTITIKIAKTKKLMLEKLAYEKVQALEGGILGIGLKDFNKSIIKSTIIDAIVKKEKAKKIIKNKSFYKDKIEKEKKEKKEKIKGQSFNIRNNKNIKNKNTLLSELIKNVLNKNSKHQGTKEISNGLNSLRSINISQISLQDQTKQVTYVEMLRLQQEHQGNIVQNNLPPYPPLNK